MAKLFVGILVSVSCCTLLVLGANNIASIDPAVSLVSTSMTWVVGVTNKLQLRENTTLTRRLQNGMSIHIYSCSYVLSGSIFLLIQTLTLYM